MEEDKEIRGEYRFGFGHDISSVRQDDLDKSALNFAGTGETPLSVMDLCCGSGTVGLQMMARGHRVTLWDRRLNLPHRKLTDTHKLELIEDDIRDISVIPRFTPYSVIICQRAIHYFPFSEAEKILFRIKEWMDPEGKLFLSASGLSTELSEGYRHTTASIQERFSMLSTTMQEKHGIREPVCLYSLEDLKSLLSLAGFAVENIWLSEFGNVKAVASLCRN